MIGDCWLLARDVASSHFETVVGGRLTPSCINTQRAEMFDTLHRSYKHTSPENTVHAIRAALNALDLLPYEECWFNPYESVYSVRIALADEQGRFGTNGKGLTKPYALASAYAEFMERLQNGLFALMLSRRNCEHLRGETGYYYAPDEKLLSEQELRSLPREILDDLFGYPPSLMDGFIRSYFRRLESHGLDGCVSVPFQDVESGNAVYLPYNLMHLTTGSNGMSAGNTAEESIYQGVCEIMERHCTSEVFLRRKTPPTIPDDFLRQYRHQHAIIQDIQRTGRYDVVVKDFSAGTWMPVLGVLIVNRAERTYSLNTGCDSSFQVALSRVLTEVYQGKGGVADIDLRALPIPEDELPCFLNDDPSSLLQRRIELTKFKTNGGGRFPKSLFAAEPCYRFDANKFAATGTLETDLEKIFEAFLREGTDVYIRDVSFLGFPSHYVYVPGLSEVRWETMSDSDEGFLLLDFDRVEDTLYRIHNCSDREKRDLAAVLDRFRPETALGKVFQIEFSDQKSWVHMPVSFFTFLLWYSMGQDAQAIRALDRFLDSRELCTAYHLCVRDYIVCKANVAAPATALSAKGHDIRVVQAVCKFLDHPEAVLEHIELPNCPACAECALASHCLSKGKVASLIRIRRGVKRGRVHVTSDNR